MSRLRRKSGRLPIRIAGGYNVITDMPLKARIVRVGNSSGIRLPKAILEQAQLVDEVELHAQPGRLVIVPSKHPRAGWKEAAKQMHERGDDRLLDSPLPTKFDADEWDW